MNLCLNGMSIQDKYIIVHGIRVTDNSEQSLHVCIFSHPDPSFLKSSQATLKKKKKRGKPATLFLLSFRISSSFTKATRWKSIQKTRRTTDCLCYNLCYFMLLSRSYTGMNVADQKKKRHFFKSSYQKIIIDLYLWWIIYYMYL